MQIVLNTKFGQYVLQKVQGLDVLQGFLWVRIRNWNWVARQNPDKVPGSKLNLMVLVHPVLLSDR